MSTTQGEVGYWRLVANWCMGANDHFVTCSWAAVGNLHAVVTTVNGTPEIMTDGEIEAMAHRMSGFIESVPTTQHGAALIDVLKSWSQYGWAGDPTMKPLYYNLIENYQIRQTIDDLGGVYAWCMLPLNPNAPPEAGIQYDFSDVAVDTDADGVYPHAVFLCGQKPGTIWLVTWAGVQEVSEEWWDRFGRDCYAVAHPAWWKRPKSVVDPNAVIA